MTSRNLPSVLVVDDTPSNLDALIEMLRDDCVLSVADSGQRALHLLASGANPDLILLDVMMPGMDGYQVCAALKREPAIRAIPVIFVTAKVDAASESEALAAGAVDFIHKPVNKDVLRARIRLHVEMRLHRDRLDELVQARTLELERARDEAEGANRAKTAFLRAVGHELLTPMNHIIGLTQLLASELPPGANRERLENVRKSSSHLLLLIEDVLEFARAEGGALAIESVDFDLHALIGRALDGVRPVAQDKQLELYEELDPALPRHLNGDPVQLRRVLDRLLGNAVKFSDRGRVTLRARRMSASSRAATLRFEVQDEGDGFSREALAGLFEPFHQGDGSMTRRHGGLGLGLATCKRLVTVMGGRIGVSSVPGQGTTFWFELHLQHATGAHPQRIAAAAALDRGAIDGIVEYLESLLAHGDPSAQILWSQATGAIRPVLQHRAEQFERHLAAFDFDAALALLREAVGAGPSARRPA